MTIKLYWHRGSGKSDTSKQNFGDYLSPLIVEAISRKKVAYAPPPKADMIAIGTILAKEYKAKRFLCHHRLHIWGSGCGKDEERFSQRHYYHAVRGIESLRRINGSPNDIQLGDPGLLAELLLSKPKVKIYRIGFVPHYADQNLPVVREFINTFPGVHFINVFSPPMEVIAEIAKCEFVISSSLHGLVISDSFSIPNIRAVLSKGIIDELKFTDYYSAFGIPPPESIDGSRLLNFDISQDDFRNNYSRPGIDRIKDALLKHFPNL